MCRRRDLNLEPVCGIFAGLGFGLFIFLLAWFWWFRRIFVMFPSGEVNRLGEGWGWSDIDIETDWGQTRLSSALSLTLVPIIAGRGSRPPGRPRRGSLQQGRTCAFGRGTKATPLQTSARCRRVKGVSLSIRKGTSSAVNAQCVVLRFSHGQKPQFSAGLSKCRSKYIS